jgi:Sap, sulfolipid-1-addressing protein
MLRLIGIVISIGLADSLNPSTIAPALYLATGERARDRVAEFTFAVFAVYLVGGTAIAFGARQLIRPLLPHPRHHIADIVELAVGVAMIAASALLWRYRDRLSDRDPPDFDPHGRSSWLLGASITAIVGSGLGPVRGLVLLVVFNLCFVLPLLGIVAILTFGGDQADRMLNAGRSFLQQHWPAVLAGLALAAGLFVALLGATGIAATHSSFIRHLHHTLHG